MKKILIVDDQESWRKYHSDAINKIFTECLIDTADSAENALSKLLLNIKNPYEYIITDMQMENSYYPLMAGEWLIEQIKNIPNFYKSKIVVISASPKIKFIAEKYSVFFIPKSSALLSLNFYEDIFIK